MTTTVPMKQDQHPLLLATTTNLNHLTNNNTNNTGIIEYELLLEKLQAGAFRSLIKHLQLHSDNVSNLDLMTISGFCRNCLAKWMVLEARQIVDNHQQQQHDITPEIMNLYNTFKYDDAAQYVYGIEYDTWKQLHMKPATSQQLQDYQKSIYLHAQHNTELLKPRPIIDIDTPTTTPTTVTVTPTLQTNHNQQEQQQQQTSSTIIENEDVEEDVDKVDDRMITTSTTTVGNDTPITPDHTTIPMVTTSSSTTTTTPMPIIPTNGIQSNVCCVDIDDDNNNYNNFIDMDKNKVNTIKPDGTDLTTSTTHTTAAVQQLPTIPDISLFRNEQFPVLAIVTISDRAYAGIYKDMSGPTIASTIRSIPNVPNDLQFVMVLVPDDSAAIQAKIHTLIDQGVDGIITTGGTGFGIRDITPEATREIIDYELRNFITYCCMTHHSTTTNNNTNHQIDMELNNHILATLSRGVTGIIQQTIIINLPGHPKSILEMIPILFPYILHIIIELQNVTPDILHIE